ncbi:MAG TPA: sugar ABC transporter substrate-binding protein, partial [Chloroflexota bacterium]|nr:sugar ABC transporter substrate-binding protein [Chloroflexota bacterium]
MTTKRAVLATLGSAAATSILAACGQGASTPQTAGKSAAPVTLRVSSWLVQPPSVEVYDKHLIEPFKQESPNTTIIVESMAFSAYPEKLQAYGASNDLPDLIEVSYAWFPEWVKLGWLENLDSVIKRDKLNLGDYDKTVIGMGKWPYEKGPTYSWWTMMGIGTFYYNKSIFDREGQKYPDESWTWDQAVEVAKKLTRPGQQWGLHLGSYEASLLYSYGASVLNDDATKSLLDSPASIKAHQFWADLFQKHRVSGTSQEYRDAGATGDAFAAGKIGMYLHGSYQIGRFRKDIKDFQWDVAPLPKGPAGRAVLISGNPSHAITAPGKNKERAWQFLRWWVGKQNANQVVLPGNTPTRLAAAKEWTEEQKKEAAPKSIGFVTEGAQKSGKRAETGLRHAEWSKVWSDTRSAINTGKVPA